MEVETCSAKEWAKANVQEWEKANADTVKVFCYTKEEKERKLRIMRGKPMKKCRCMLNVVMRMGKIRDIR